jgi:hypothetical protein
MTDHAYFAFLDILGYKEQLDVDVKSGTSVFKDGMIRAFRVFDTVNQSRYSYKAISDSIFISCGERDAAQEFLELTREVFVAFLSEKLLIRGGVSFGAHFQNQFVTYSPVLTKAYVLESQVAQAPRVMVDGNIVEMFPGLNSSGLLHRSGEHWFLNIVSARSFDTVWSYAKSAFEANRETIRRDERVRAKHRWLQEFLIESAEDLSLEVPVRYLPMFDSAKTAV